MGQLEHLLVAIGQLDRVDPAGILVLERIALAPAFAVEVEHQGNEETEEGQKSEFGNIECADDIGSVHFTFLS